MRKSALKALLFVCLTIQVGSAAAETDDVLSQYKMLEWKDLVPSGWEPPLVPPAHDSAESARVPPEAVVTELNDQRVTLPGFIKPIAFEGDKVLEFLLVPFLPQHLKQHAHLDANQMVYVSPLAPLSVDKPFDPIWVVGTLTIDTVPTDEGPAAYRIVDAVITEYTY